MVKKSFCIIDAQSVKMQILLKIRTTTRVKRFHGHIAVDTQGLPNAIHVITEK
ncbi:MAG: hypothetical protein ACR5KV_00830 [Wolbachia sp.]